MPACLARALPADGSHVGGSHPGPRVLPELRHDGQEHFHGAWGSGIARAAAVTVYVDDVRHRFGRMTMCHMWADTLDELLAMADRIGVARRWLQQPPAASWVHFDVSLGAKAKALAAGAVLTDRYGPVEHVARLRGDTAKIETIAALRARHAERGTPCA